MIRQYSLLILSVILFFTGACSSRNSDAEYIEPEFDILAHDVYNPYLIHFDSMPPAGRKIKVKNIGPLARVFNDSNYLHLRAAQQIGIQPINTTADAWNISRPVVKTVSCRNFYVDELNFSLPFLVPEAYNLLDEIGRTFIDSLNARGGGDYRIKVTSVLRTPATVARLRRRNRNAVDSSAHIFGTTFDISYAKFICDSANTIPRTQEDLKNLLAEILADLRDNGRCYIKYERKQACFHITARPSL